MNCHEVTEALEGYIAGDLDDREASRVAEHLKTCRACAAAYDDTRELVAELKDLSVAFRPTTLDTHAFDEAPRTTRGSGRRERSWTRAWAVAAAVLLVALAGVVAVATVPSVARTVPLPVGSQLKELQRENQLVQAENRAMEQRVETLEERIKTLTGDDVNVVPTSGQDIPDAVTIAVQEVVIEFIKAQYAGDLQRMKALATPALDARIEARPEEYLRDDAGTVSFAQMTDVGVSDGLYLTFVRLSDTKEFSDSQYQENFAVKKVGDRYLVEYVEMDA